MNIAERGKAVPKAFGTAFLLFRKRGVVRGLFAAAAKEERSASHQTGAEQRGDAGFGNVDLEGYRAAVEVIDLRLGLAQARAAKPTEKKPDAIPLSPELSSNCPDASSS